MKKIFLFAMIALISFNSSMAKVVSTIYRNCLVFAYSQANSIKGDDNIEFRIYDECLYALNKTDKTIFIDLSQCFLYHNGVARPMLVKDNDKKKKEGISSIDEFMSIPPSSGTNTNYKFICPVTTVSFYGNYTTSENPSGDFSEYDTRLLTVLNELIMESLSADPKGKEYVGTASRHMTEDESINQIGASVAYAFNKRSEDWTTVNISTWVSDVIFAPYCVEMPQDLKKKDMKGFGVKETAPAIVKIKGESPFETIDEKSPLIVADWSGNFKKGTFELQTTRIQKTKGKGWAFLAALTGQKNAASLIWEQYYKRVVSFEGSDVDWGKMSYSNDPDGRKLEQKIK